MIGNVKGSFVSIVFKYFRSTSANIEDVGTPCFIHCVRFVTVALVFLFHCCSCYVRFSISLCTSDFYEHQLQT